MGTLARQPPGGTRAGITLTLRRNPVVTPRNPGRFTFPASERSSGTGGLTALAVSPSVTVTGSSGSPLTLLIILLAALITLATAATLAVRGTRHRAARGGGDP